MPFYFHLHLSNEIFTGFLYNGVVLQDSMINMKGDLYF